jgi:hypothetical protein
LLNISPEILRKNFHDSSHRGIYYRSYFIKVNNISDTQYLNNVNILRRNNAPSFWRETDKLAHIPIKNITYTSLLTNGNVKVKDINGKIVTLHNRIRQCLAVGYDVMLKVAQDKACADATTDGSISRSAFREGTFTIKKSLS